ncbi:hypothetical protein AMK16_00815 [Streptomyces sp. CB00455]|uniref:hypothetical protein n=1 Tax=Streptomyces sp. CB00455 TaxID=1703927 RepID=UPI00093C63E2|nr:hypothetical protein [Streptomyces sp. CB00455]OKK21851.1 hypothetical protein AMK16_00815 [Streptomyces sp. CB00455]
MTRTSLTQRLALLGASGALAAGGALLPTSAFAAPAPQVAAVQAAPDHQAHPVGTTTTTRIETQTVKRTLSDGRVKVTTTKTVTKTTRNHHGQVVKKTITKTVTTRILPAPDDD